MKLETGNSASIITFRGNTPKIHPTAFLCEGVRIIGEVEIGKNCSVWYNSVIRGDIHYVRIGKNTVVQDMCAIHVTDVHYPVEIGENVGIAHSATIHGSTIRDNCMIGIGATTLDGCIVNSYSIVAAGALVREGFEVPEGTLVAGVPARVIRDITPQEAERIKITSTNYLRYVAEYRAEIRKASK